MRYDRLWVISFISIMLLYPHIKFYSRNIPILRMMHYFPFFNELQQNTDIVKLRSKFMHELSITDLIIDVRCDSNGIRTHNHLVWFRLAKWLSAHLRTKWLSVRIQLLSLKLQIFPVSSEKFFDIQATIECRFHPKSVRDMISNSWL